MTGRADRKTMRLNSRPLAARAGAIGFCCLALAGCRQSDFPQFPANYHEYAYVTNGVSGTVSVLDVVNVRVDREIATGQNPVAVAASPTRNEVYVVNSGAKGAQGSVTVIDAEKNAAAATIPCSAILSQSMWTARASWPMLPTQPRTRFLS